ncbi:MAG: OstA-like protein, partial [Bacteroidales bacterium]
MNKIFTERLFICLFFAGLHCFCFAQNFRGDRMENIPGRSGVWMLRGNVHITSDGNLVLSDYAEYDQNTKSCIAYGNLRIRTREKALITGKKLDYDGRSQVYYVVDDVVLKDGDIVMKTPSLRYEGRSNVANYDQGAIMTSGATVLKSDKGNYKGSSKTFYCYRNVVIVNPDYTIWTDTMFYHRTGMANFYGPTNIETTDYYMYCRQGWFSKNEDKVSLQKDAYIKTKESQTLYGDSIFYDLKKKNGNAHRNVFLKDTLRNCFIKSEYGENNEQKGYAFFTINPRSVLVDHGDSLFMVGDTMRITYDTGKQIKKIYVYSQVKFYKEGMQGLCDSLVYIREDSIMYLHKNPMVWMDDYQIDGDTIRVWFANDKPRRLLVNEDAFMVAKALFYKNYYNQIKGKQLWGYFDDSSRFIMAQVQGRAQSIYYVLNDQQTEL